MIKAVKHETLPMADGIIRIGGLPALSVRRLPAMAVIDDEAPIGEHVMFLVVGGRWPSATPVLAERVAELLRRHGLADVPETPEGVE